jgi:hypothetical protein
MRQQRGPVSINDRADRADHNVSIDVRFHGSAARAGARDIAIDIAIAIAIDDARVNTAVILGRRCSAASDVDRACDHSDSDHCGGGADLGRSGRTSRVHRSRN